jgi:hypothetical protein
MRTLVFCFALGFGTAPLRAAEPVRPLAEKYLHAGELARGEQALAVVLDARPKDDQLRFGLGVVQFARAIEHLGQSLYQYGAKSENATAPFLRVPVPKNDKPHTVSYEALGRTLDVFVADLGRAERTLAGVTDDKVKLPLRLAAVKFDFARDGKPTEKLIDVLARLNGGRFEFQKDNPDLLVCFDRGDVAWLRAYCHLLSAMVEAYRAVDLEWFVEDRVRHVFPKVEPSRRKPANDNELVITDGARLGRFRKHMLEVCKLNRETWRHIRAETDNDHEWLPHAKQKSVIGLPVEDARIDGWLDFVDTLEGLLTGERLVSPELLQFVGWKNDGKGVNLAKLLDDPPAKLSNKKLRDDGIGAKYLEKVGDKKTFGLIDAFRVWNVLNDGPFGFAYAAWFN